MQVLWQHAVPWWLCLCSGLWLWLGMHPLLDWLPLDLHYSTDLWIIVRECCALWYRKRRKTLLPCSSCSIPQCTALLENDSGACDYIVNAKVSAICSMHNMNICIWMTCTGRTEDSAIDFWLNASVDLATPPFEWSSFPAIPGASGMTVDHYFIFQSPCHILHIVGFCKTLCRL